jgi:hypothetical protein
VSRDVALRRPRPAVWLNLVCLDAPVVAVIWQWLFAQTFEVPASVGNSAALFLTAWLIYLGDRLADASSLSPGSPRSLRQEFCVRHREIWLVALLMMGGLDAYVIWQTTAAVTFVVGMVVGLLALIYLLLNHPLGRIWRVVPLKECAIGFVFAAGTLVALLPAIPQINGAFLLAAVAFAFLCALNCISIACWERALDETQRKTSIATRHPAVASLIGKIAFLLALAVFGAALIYRDAAMVFGCVGVSAILLAVLDTWRGTIGEDQQTALADLVLLTPAVALIFANA